jgi:putative spermidine/putrescine transport system ATP-binding protein
VLAGAGVEVYGTRLPLVTPAPPSQDVVTALVRPESVDVVPDPDGPGKVLTASFLGPFSRVIVQLGDDLVTAQVASGRVTELAPGTPVRVELRPVAVALEATS